MFNLTAALLIFTTTSTTIGIYLCQLWGSLTPMISVASLALGAVFGVITFFYLGNKWPSLELKRPSRMICSLVFLTALFIHFYWLLYEKGGVLYFTDDSNLVDQPNHIMYINYFSNGAKFWPRDPFYLTAPLTYPFGTDFFTSLFSTLGLSYFVSIPLLGLVFSCLLYVALIVWGGSFALLGFLFAGGGYGLQFFSTFKLVDYQNGKPWQSLLPLFSSQRGYLYAMPAGLILLWSWRNRFFSDVEKKYAPLSPILEAVLWGTMPFFHVHTFIFLSFTFLCWSVGTKNFLGGIRTLAWALPLGAFEIFQVTAGFSTRHLMGFKWGWMIGDQNLISFFWNNYGFFAVLTPIMIYAASKSKNSMKLLFPSLFLFAVCFCVLFAPYDWDNNKIMIWCYLCFLPLIYKLTLKRRSPWIKAVTFILLFLPGALAILARSQPGGKKISSVNMNFEREICRALRSIRPEEAIATAQIHPNMILMCGHRVVAPFSSFYWLMGRDGKFFELRLPLLMNGEMGWREVAAQLKTRYIFWGTEEKRIYRKSYHPWTNGSFKIIAKGDWGEIYDIGQ